MSIPKADYVIAGGLVAGGSGIARHDVSVRGGLIEAVGPGLAEASAERVIDATGMYVLPGIIDAHNHPVYADRVDTFSVSAAFGGITTIIPFIRNRRNEGLQDTTTEAANAFIDEARRDSVLDFGVHAILLGDDDVDVEVPALIEMGIISFKMYMTYPRRGIMMPDDRMLRAMELAARDGGIAMVHAENGYCIDYLVDRFTREGKTSREHYAPSQPRILEVEAANRAATYAEVAGCPLYVVHLSAREVVEVIERFKSGGTRIFGETCPQYLSLTNQTTLDHGALAKIGPPLREPEDNEAMWRGIASRVIDTVASDFCGYKKEQKQSGGLSAANIGEHARGEPSIFDASFGGNWAEQMLPVVYHDGVNMGRITLPRLVQVMCENPAKIFGLYPQKGTLQPGADADIVIFDPAQEHTLSAADQHTNADFTMFEGKQVIGKPVFSMQRGQILIENGELHRPRGKAKYLPGKPELAAYAKGGHSVR